VRGGEERSLKEGRLERRKDGVKEGRSEATTRTTYHLSSRKDFQLVASLLTAASLFSHRQDDLSPNLTIHPVNCRQEEQGRTSILVTGSQRGFVQ
jgi:hypothetical protein